MQATEQSVVIEQHMSTEEHITQICGFWRRLCAFFIDSSVLAIPAITLGYIFFDFFVSIGSWGLLGGFTVALVYFACLNSSIGNGQTLGKRLMKIQVVTKEGQTIPFHTALIRFVVLGVPYFLNGTILPIDSQSLALLFSVTTFFGFVAIIYLYIFNRKTRQSLHDLVAKTYVVTAPASPPVHFEPIWRGHLAVVGLIFLTVVTVLTIVFPKLTQNEFFSDLLRVQQDIQSSGLVRTSGVTVGKSFKVAGSEGQRESTYLSVNAILTKCAPDYNEVINQLAAVVLKTYPLAMEKDAIVIKATCGFDIGIASLWKSHRQQHSPKEWMDLLTRRQLK